MLTALILSVLLLTGVLQAVPANSDGCDPSSNSISGYRKCYSRGPVLAKSMLPAPKNYGVAGSIVVNCEESVGYILALNRFYERRCIRLRHECPPELQYAITWFATVGTDLAIQCDSKRTNMAVSAANEQEYDSRFPDILAEVDYDPDPYYPTYKPEIPTPSSIKSW